jgi:hypothetical protein
MSAFGVIPSKILFDNSLSDSAKILYAIITSHASASGRMPFSLHRLSMISGYKHFLVKAALNELAKAKHIYRVSEFISLHPPTEEDKQMELNFDFVTEIVNIWNDTFKKEMKVGYPVTDTLSGYVNLALKSFSKDDLVRAVRQWRDYCMNDDWWSKDSNRKHMTNLLSFFQKEERIHNALNFDKNKVDTGITPSIKGPESSNLLE